MVRVILSVFCIWVATDAFAADEAVLFPDVTPATTTEFGYSKILEQELLVRLEGTGFMVLNGEVLSQGVREQMLLCAEDESCPAKPLAAVPARIALVVRAEKKDGKYQVDASVYQQGVAAALDSKQLLVGLDELPQTAQQIADFLDDTADQTNAHHSLETRVPL